MDDKVIFNQIKENIVNYYCDEYASPEKYLSLVTDEGSFYDLDYIKQDWGGKWGPYQHITRIQLFCSIYRAKNNIFYKNAALKEAIFKCVDFFIEKKFKSDNWWMNDVGVPTACGIIRLLFKEELTELQERELFRIASGNPELPRFFKLNANPLKNSLRPYLSQGTHMTSQLVDTHIFLVVNDEDPQQAMDIIRDCIKAINIEFDTVTYASGKSPSGLYEEEHCIKSDYSYHEHENEMLQNTYGMAMIEAIGNLFLFWENSDIRLYEKATKELINLLLDGYSMLRFRCAVPMMTLGRDAANSFRRLYHRPEQIQALKLVCDTLLSYNVGYRSEELLSFRNRIYEPMTTKHFTRTKYFWHSDLISHNRPTYQFVAHAVSNRMKRPESCLGRNILGMFLGDGSYNLMQTSYEYEGIAPYMDWQKVPGTTVTCGKVDLNPECEIDTTIDTERIFGGAKGTTSFVGGVSDEKNGMFAFDYYHLNVKAKKAYFCFDEGVVCLGAGISSDNSDGVFTTINQCKLLGDVCVDGSLINQGEHILPSCQTVFADGIGYMFFDSLKDIYLVNETRSGCWSRVDCQSGTDDSVSGQIFLLGINHGAKPMNETYSYMLLPDMDVELLEKVSKRPPVKIISNTKCCQAVKHNLSGQIQAVFYNEGVLKVESITICVNRPCALILSFNKKEYSIWLSNPMHEEAKITVKLSGEITDEITFVLKAGYRFNDLGRPMCYDSKKGFVPYVGAQTDKK